MSANNDVSLTTRGQLLLTGSTAVLTNGLTHPLCTLKNLWMAVDKKLTVREFYQEVKAGRITVHGLYRGYNAMCAVDFGTLATAYYINNKFKKQIGELAAATLAGFASVPIVTFGEGLMVNRQVHNMSYKQAFTRALRLSAVGITLCREVPFPMGVFVLTPFVEKKIPVLKGIPKQFLGGFIAGAVAGWATNPFDLIKTRVQATPQPLSLKQACLNIRTEGPGLRPFLAGGILRFLYMGKTGALMNVFYSNIPFLLPKSFQTKQ